jgi:hypothetical protein
MNTARQNMRTLLQKKVASIDEEVKTPQFKKKTSNGIAVGLFKYFLLVREDEARKEDDSSIV